MKLLPKYHLIFIVLLAISILIGCSSEPDPRLERIDRLSEKDSGLARTAASPFKYPLNIRYNRS